MYVRAATPGATSPGDEGVPHTPEAFRSPNMGSKPADNLTGESGKVKGDTAANSAGAAPGKALLSLAGDNPAFKDREEIRKYLESLHPEKVKALKNKSPDEYRAILKSMVRKLFPDGADIQFRMQGELIDYDHFLTDRTRQDYIHTLPGTLRREDVKLEFRNGDIDKEILIKKYFDEDIQQDIWDVVVLHNNEIRTKIARKGRKGAGYAESLMNRAGNAASRSATPDEPAKSASPHLGNTKDNVTDDSAKVKGDEVPDQGNRTS
jgi:hypothetical protein